MRLSLKPDELAEARRLANEASKRAADAAAGEKNTARRKALRSEAGRYAAIATRLERAQAEMAKPNIGFRRRRLPKSPGGGAAPALEEE